MQVILSRFYFLRSPREGGFFVSGDFKELVLLHLSKQQVAQYGHQNLSVADLLSVDEHLSDCAECRDRIVGFWRAARASSTLENDISSYDVNPHLVYQDQVKYFSGQLTEERLEYCLNHIIWCEPCRIDLIDFSIFYSHLNPLGDDLLGEHQRLRNPSTQVSGSLTDFSSRQFFKSLDE